MRDGNEAGVKEWAEIVGHALLVCVVLSVWVFTAWWVDKILLSHLPLEGMSIISFRLLEIILHLSTLRIIYRSLFKPRVQPRWWV
jgi:hypothetical protein